MICKRLMAEKFLVGSVLLLMISVVAINGCTFDTRFEGGDSGG